MFVLSLDSLSSATLGTRWAQDAEARQPWEEEEEWEVGGKRHQSLGPTGKNAGTFYKH